MGPKGRLYKPEYALELLEIAEGDLKSAIGLARIKEGRVENICYLAQQCAEKALKAALCNEGKMILHTHDLDALASHLPEDKIPPRSHQIGSLTEYSMIRRYEKGYEVIDDESIQLALELARDVLEWAQALCAKKS